MSQPVEIAPYSEEWPALFRTLGRSMRDVLGDVAIRIDHIGSTAVPHLGAKPVVDVQVSVPSLEPLEAYRSPLEQLGFVLRANPELTKRYSYTDAKAPFIWEVLRAADRWSQEVGWEPGPSDA
jgi:GrpB-like predicted nucleotidyltransferase (UPF0157 family)